MKVELDINKREAHGRGRAAHEPARLPARQAAAHRRACRLRARRLRRLHRADRRRGGALLPDVRGAGRRLCHHHHRRAVARAGRAVAAAGCVLRDPRHAVRLLHAGDDPRRARAAVEATRSRRARRSSTPSPATSAAAPAMRRSSRRSRSPPSACAARTSRRISHERAGQIPLRLVRPPRARGSPLRRRQGPLRRRHRAAGRQARRAGDLPASGRAHRLDRQVRGAGDARRALRARRARSWPAPPTCSPTGLDTPNVPRWPLALERRALRRRMGRGGGGRQPRARRGRRRGGRGRIRAAAVRARRRGGLCRRHAGARGARLQRAARPHLRLGRGREGFRREPAQAQAPREMGPQRDGADRDLRRRRRAGTPGAKSSTSGPRSRCRNIPTRSRWR